MKVRSGSIKTSCVFFMWRGAASVLGHSMYGVSGDAVRPCTVRYEA